MDACSLTFFLDNVLSTHRKRMPSKESKKWNLPPWLSFSNFLENLISGVLCWTKYFLFLLWGRLPLVPSVPEGQGSLLLRVQGHGTSARRAGASPSRKTGIGPNVERVELIIMFFRRKNQSSDWAVSKSEFVYLRAFKDGLDNAPSAPFMVIDLISREHISLLSPCVKRKARQLFDYHRILFRY